MEGELVTDSSSSDTEKGSGEDRSPSCSYAEKFDELLPYYIAIGMTVDEYWNGDPSLCRVYRKAQEIRDDQANQHLWLQGMYIYEAIGDMAPILRAFAEKGAKALPYPEAPYPLTETQRRAAEERKAKKAMEEMRNHLREVIAMDKEKKKEEMEVTKRNGSGTTESADRE